MANPLDSTWRAYNITLDSYRVVWRSLSLGAAERAAALRGTRFAALATDRDIRNALDAAQDELDDQTLMFVYATFEAALRDHVSAQAPLLASAVQPGAQFGPNLQAWFTELCRDTRFDKVVELFEPWSGTAGVAEAASIRRYRHWLAHGRRGTVPPVITPQFAYNSLTSFLQACGLA